VLGGELVKLAKVKPGPARFRKFYRRPGPARGPPGPCRPLILMIIISMNVILAGCVYARRRECSIFAASIDAHIDARSVKASTLSNVLD
jgi:hypothetical protein